MDEPQARAGHLEEFKVEFSLPEANNPPADIWFQEPS
jgi:hypothetical protein